MRINCAIHHMSVNHMIILLQCTGRRWTGVADEIKALNIKTSEVKTLEHILFFMAQRVTELFHSRLTTYTRENRMLMFFCTLCVCSRGVSMIYVYITYVWACGWGAMCLCVRACMYSGRVCLVTSTWGVINQASQVAHQS